MKRFLNILVIVGLIIPFTLYGQSSRNAYLTINVNVDGVEIKINGNSYGIASTEEPIIEEMSAGSYKISATKEGYKTDVKNIVLQAGESQELTFTLERPQAFEVDKDKDTGIIGVEYGSLTVVVKKKGKLVPAKVYIDDKFADNAPVTINKLTVSLHEIRVSYKGLVKEKEVQIIKNKKELIEIELLTVSKVSIESKVSGTNLNIEYQSYNLPNTVDLNKGKYKFKFSKYGYKSAEKDIYINGDNDYRIIANLSTNFPNVTAYTIGRENKERVRESDLRKDEYSYKKREYHTMRGIACVGGLVLGAIIGNAAGEGIGPPAVGGLLGYGLGWLVPTKTKEVKMINKYNVRYNKYKLPKIVESKNREIDRYNSETEKLIKEEQMKLYLKNAIKVYEE